jgi:hypothetical protein
MGQTFADKLYENQGNKPRKIRQELIATKGEIRYFIQTADKLPAGWIVPNGDIFPLNSAIGKALNDFDTDTKANWGIVVNGSNINAPTLFHSDGRAYFLRGVDGATRQVGSVEEDAIQNLTGDIFFMLAGQTALLGSGSGVFSAKTPQSTTTFSPTGTLANQNSVINFNASNVARTDTETRSINAGFTPAIFIGV